MMIRIRTAVIGTGFMGRTHLEALRRVENVDVVEVAATSLDKARAAAAGYNVLNATGDWRDVIADPSIDAVHITTPNDSHFPIAKAAFEAGKHVLCEKPLAMSVAEARSAGGPAGREKAARRGEPQSALLPDGAADAPHARSRRIWRNPGGPGHLFPGLDAVSRPTGTGAWIRQSAAHRG